MKIPTVHVKKLDDRSKMVIYLGKEPGTKGSRLYDPKTGKLHISRDITVQENQFWSWEQNRDTELVLPGNYVEMGSMGEDMDDTEVESEIATPVQLSPSQSYSVNSATATGESSAGTTAETSSLSGRSTESGPKRYRALSDIYNDTEMVDLIDELMLLKIEGPSTFKEAAGERKWEEAMKTKFDTIEKNGTWTLTELPPYLKFASHIFSET
ncbi:uncharacterized protein LOC141659764 [Apium graveolens]|uniref:uncharacterized protein LOC141659764 n=1 Tax=Apium graveolens TaxID=4045 RepID=UPI003D7B1B6D